MGIAAVSPADAVADATAAADGGAPPSLVSRLSSLGSATDRIPTRWFAGIGTVAFLIATAAFGGFADVPPVPTTTIEIGEAHTSDQLTLEVQSIVVLDDIPELYLTVPPGERVVAVLAHATNEWNEPLSGTSVHDVLRLDVEGISDERPMVIARVDDAIPNPRLQPGLRVPLAFVWTVPSALLSAGDDVTVEVFDQTLRTGTAVIDGQYWSDPTLAAVLTAPVEDLGTGEEEQ